MPRPKLIHDDQILDAARTLFLEKGFTATTAEVARRARCAEGSVFKRFATKAELFQAAMEPRADELHWLAELADQIGRPGFPERLLCAGLEAMDLFRAWLPMMMMMWSNPSARCAMSDHHGAAFHGVLQRLGAIFADELPNGRDPEMLAHVFLGGILHFVMVDMMGGRSELAPVPFLRGLVAQLLD